MAGKNMSFKNLSENAMHYKLEGGRRQCRVEGKKWLKLEFLRKSDTQSVCPQVDFSGQKATISAQ